MRIFNLLIAILGLFAMLRILTGIFLANLHQVKTNDMDDQTRKKLAEGLTQTEVNNYREKHPYKVALSMMFGGRGLPRVSNQIRRRMAKLMDPHQLTYYPLMSVVIPAYNEEKTIVDCVTSVLNQNYPNRQIIVVDDGSTDRTFEILENLKEHFYSHQGDYQPFDSNLSIENCLIVVHQPNGGKSVALNHGIKDYAKGEIVTVLDSDSTLASDALLKMSQHFKDPKTLAMADNVRIAKPKKMIEHVQEFE